MVQARGALVTGVMMPGPTSVTRTPRAVQQCLGLPQADPKPWYD